MAQPQGQGRSKTGRKPATDVRQVRGEGVGVSAEELQRAGPHQSPERGCISVLPTGCPYHTGEWGKSLFHINNVNTIKFNVWRDMD